jgi:ABC-type dipeptide/oligopeptide/nickel transport system permease subunit
MGSLRPKFHSIPDEYYPLTAGEVACYATLVVLTIGGALGVMIGFLQWVTTYGLEVFVQVWSIVFLVFVVVMIIAFYVGGRRRIRQGKRLILQAQNEK